MHIDSAHQKDPHCFSWTLHNINGTLYNKLSFCESFDSLAIKLASINPSWTARSPHLSMLVLVSPWILKGYLYFLHFIHFRRVHKIAKSDYLSHVCLSVCIELRSHWMHFHEIWYVCIFRSSVDNIQVPLNSDNSSVYFTWRPMNISDPMSLHSSKNDTLLHKNVEKIKTRFIYDNVFRKSCRLWNNVGKYCTAGQDTDDNIIRRMRFAFRIFTARI